MRLEAFDAEELGADGLLLVRNNAVGGRTVLIVRRTTRRPRKHHFDTAELRWPTRMGQEKTPRVSLAYLAQLACGNVLQ